MREAIRGLRWLLAALLLFCAFAQAQARW